MKLKSLFKKKPKRTAPAIYPLVPVYTMPDGTNYYTFETPGKLPALRFLELELAQRMLEMRITPELLADRLQSMIEACNQGKLTQVAATIEELKLRNQLKAEKNSLLKVATIFYLKEGEDPANYSETIAAEKLKAWTDDRNALDFFLLRAWSLVGNLAELSATTLTSYVLQAEEALKIPVAQRTTAKSGQESKSGQGSSTKSTTKSQGASPRKL